MNRRIVCCLSLAWIALASATTQAAEPFHKVVDTVNEKMVKLFGAGGFRGVTNYGSGVLISPDGHILTAASQLLDTSELIVHLYDGRRMRAAVLVIEPELDAALVKIRIDGVKDDEATGLDLPYFDFAEAAKRPPAQVGDWVLSFSNSFEIAMRDEAVSVQRGVVAATSKLVGRRGIFDFPFNGDVYVVDAITNNPGSAGGALTDRNGNLLGLIGREIRNTLTETWINYAIPVHAKTTVQSDDKEVTLTLPDFVSKGMKGEYKPVERTRVAAGEGGYHGIVFVPNILERTPPYVDGVRPNSPAEKSGLQPDDLVSFFDGEPVFSIKTFNEYMSRTRPGMTVRLEVRRGDRLQTVEMELAEHPSAPKAKK